MENKGTKDLEKLLEVVSEMTVEEYEKLYEEAIKIKNHLDETPKIDLNDPFFNDIF